MSKILAKSPAGDNYRRLGAAQEMLKVVPTEVPSLSVKVNAGTFFLNGKIPVEVEETISAPLSLPTINSFWVCVGISGSTGTLTMIYGPQSSGVPAFPTVPSNFLVLAGVLLSSNDTAITSSMIKDLRPVYGVSSVISAHDEMENRDAADQHPISAITGLQDALDSKISTDTLNAKLAKYAEVDGTSSNTFTLQTDLVGAASDNAEIIVNRGNQPAAKIRWNEGEKNWEISNGSKYVGIATKEDTDAIAGIDPSTIAIKADVSAEVARLDRAIAEKADEDRLDEVVIALADKIDRTEFADAIQNIPNRQMMLDAIAAAENASKNVNNKADKDSVYTKEEAEERFLSSDELGDYATIEDVNNKIDDVNIKFDDYMLTEDIQIELDKKADKTTTYTKEEVDTALADKIDTLDVYTKEEVDQKFEESEAISYSKAEIDQKLVSKADIDDVYKYLDNSIAMFPTLYQAKLNYTPENVANKDIPGGYPSLDSNGKLSVDVLPDLGDQKTYVVNTKVELDALENLQSGDKAFILDDGENTGDSYIYDGTQWIKFADADWANVNLSFQNIVDKPSTISGYGITDTYTNAEVDAFLEAKAPVLHTHNASDISTSDNAQFTTRERNEKIDALPAVDEIPTITTIDTKIAEAVAGIDFVDDNELQTALTDYAKTEDVNTAINNAVAGIDFVDDNELQTTLTDYAKSTDVSTEIDEKVAAAVADIDFVDDTELQNALADYAKSADVTEEINNAVAGIDFVDNDELQTALSDYAKSEDVNTALDSKADKTDLNVFATQEYVDNADALKADKASLFKNDLFYVKQEDTDGSYNVFWHEKNSGGGNQYYNALTNTISYLGVNKPTTAGSDVDIQLYSKDKTSNIGTRINISSQKGLFYLKNGLNLGFPEGREVLVKDDLNGFAKTEDINAVVDTYFAEGGALDAALAEKDIENEAKFASKSELNNYVTSVYADQTYATKAECETTYQKKNENIILIDSNGVKYEIGIDTAGNITATVKNE